MIIQTHFTTNSIDKPESSGNSKKTGDIVIRNLPPTVTQKVREVGDYGEEFLSIPTLLILCLNITITNLAGNLCIARSL